MIPRILSALMVASIYAALTGAFTFLVWRLTHDPGHPGAMIPDNNGWGRLMVFFMTLVAGVLGGVVALVISIARIDKLAGALIGAGVGGVLFAFVLVKHFQDFPQSPRYRIELLQSLGLFFVVFPLGLTLTGLAASFVASKLPKT